MSRIHRFRPEELSEEQRKVYTDITTGSRASSTEDFRLLDDEGRLEGPFNAMLLNPTIGDLLQQLGAAIRYRGLLSDRSRELAILTVAAHWRSQFEQRVHESVGARIGLTDEELQALRSGASLTFDDEEEAAVVWTTRHLLRQADLDDNAFAFIINTLEPEKLFELTVLIGYYSLLALQMRVFGVT